MDPISHGNIKCANCMLYSKQNHQCDALVAWWILLKLDDQNSDGNIWHPETIHSCESYKPLTGE